MSKARRRKPVAQLTPLRVAALAELPDVSLDASVWPTAMDIARELFGPSQADRADVAYDAKAHERETANRRRRVKEALAPFPELVVRAKALPPRPRATVYAGRVADIRALLAGVPLPDKPLLGR